MGILVVLGTLIALIVVLFLIGIILPSGENSEDMKEEQEEGEE